MSTVSTEFRRQIDANAASLVEAYRVILKKAAVGATVEPQDDLLVAAAAAMIETHTHSLLEQVDELRKQLLLLDVNT
jgi:hypothetical protein